MSVEKSGKKSRGRPFQKGGKQGPGRGPKKGAPNAGRPPSAIRDMLRRSFEERVKVLEDIADGEVVLKVKAGGTETSAMASADPSDRLRAVEMMAKYGLGPPPQEVELKAEVTHFVAEVPPKLDQETWASRYAK